MIQLILIACFALFLYSLQRMVYKKLWARDLGVRIRFENEELFEGDKSRLLEIIENGKGLPLTMIHVKFQTDRNLRFADEAGAATTDKFYRNDIFQINGYEKITRRLSFEAKKRGFYQVTHADLVGTDMCMTTRFYSETQNSTRLYVYPKPMTGEEMRLSLQRLNGEILAKKHLLEDPFEYHGIREYQPWDDVKLVNWKATAKTGDLKVNQRGATSLKEVRVFLNIDDRGILKKEDCVEACFRIAAGVCKYLTDQGMRVSLFCNGVDLETGFPTTIEASSGKNHLKSIYKALARIDLQNSARNFFELYEERVLTKGNDLLSIFIAPNTYTDFAELIGKYKAAGGMAVWYIPVNQKEEPEYPAELKGVVRLIHIE